MNGESVHVTLDGTVIVSSKERRGGAHAYPSLVRYRDGALVAGYQIDRDMFDARRAAVESNDGGMNWHETDRPEDALAIGEQNVIHRSNCSYETDEPGHFLFGIRRSSDGGKSWGKTEIAHLHLPECEGVDIYDPPKWWRPEHDRLDKLGFFKHPRPPTPDWLEPVVKKASLRRGPVPTQVLPLPDGTLVGVMTMRANREPVSSMAAVRSSDAAVTWNFEGFAARDPGLEAEDGFCEPGLVRYGNGEIICVMRIGSRKPLYLVRSQDEGRTWSAPVELPFGSVMPRVEVLAEGILAVATGRPDNALHFSRDRGRTWPTSLCLQRWSLGFRSTGYNAICEIEPARLLYIFDSAQEDPSEEEPWLRRHGFGIIYGHFLRIE